MTCVIAAKAKEGCLFAADSGAWEQNQSYVMSVSTPKVFQAGQFVIGGAGCLAQAQFVMRHAGDAQLSNLEDLSDWIHSLKVPNDEAFRLLAYDTLTARLAEVDGGGSLSEPECGFAAIGGAQSYVMGDLIGREFTNCEGLTQMATCMEEAIISAAINTQDAKRPVRWSRWVNNEGRKLEELDAC